MVLLENLQILYKFFLALALGALIGIEREKSHLQHKGTDFAGIRTFMLISTFGALAAYLAEIFYSWLLAVIIVCFVLVVISAYILTSFFNKETGMTTELSAIMAFIIGIMVFTAPQEIPILITVVITLVLSFKTHIHQFVYSLKSVEFIDTIKFLLIAFVILPLLKPIEGFGPFNAINLYEIWLMVVFVSGLSYIGYILIKIFGTNRGTMLTGFLGGILSSTAVTMAFANKSRENESEINSFVIAASIASITMFIRVLIEVSILNFSMIDKLTLPMVLMAIAGYLSISIKWRRLPHTQSNLEFKSPLLLKPALKFGFFYGFIILAASFLDEYIGSKGILIAALISGIADVDAITIFIARNPGASEGLGIAAITFAATVNTAVKIIIARFFGSQGYWTGLLKLLLPTLVVGMILVLLV